MSDSVPLSRLFHNALLAARERLGDPLARVAFLTPAHASGEQIRRSLGTAGHFVHVDFMTPQQVVTALGQLRFLKEGLQPEPGDWLSALLSSLLPELGASDAPDHYRETITAPGWRAPITSALSDLFKGRVEAAQLDALVDNTQQGRRFALLGTLMRQVEMRREAAGIFSDRQVEDEALLAIVRGDANPINTVRAVIVVGDGILSPGAFKVTRRWLSTRDVTEIALPPLCHLPAAETGLRAAIGEAHHRITASAGDRRLGHLKGTLFCEAPSAPGPEDESVTLVSTPDEVREIAETVREVQRAIVAGTPLDQIAIVLPDTGQAHVLASALDRAAIRASWLTGPSLERTGAANFLTLSLALADGEPSQQRWYELLMAPGLRRKSSRKQSRWRRLLASCRADTGPELIKELQRARQQASANGDQKQEESIHSLVTTLEEIVEAMAGLPCSGTLGQHGVAWRAYLERFWRDEPHRKRLERLLGQWGHSGGVEGAKVTRATGVELLKEGLSRTSSLAGGLTRPTVRVLPPMLVLGGEFQLVCVTGMTEGRLPRQLRENALLTDAMKQRLRAVGAGLVDPETRSQVEQRRLAAIIAGCAGRLWVACPKFTMMDSSPSLPSSLLLELASTLKGARVGFAELEATMTRAGSRSRPVPENPEDALGAGEHLLARVIQAQAETLPALSTQGSARRLMQLNRSIDRFAAGEAPDAWTGVIPEESMPVKLETLTVTPREFAQWLLSPMDFLMSRVLGVTSARRLGGKKMNTWTFNETLLDAITEALGDDAEGFDERFHEAWSARLNAHQERNGLDETTAAIWSQMGARAVERLKSAGLDLKEGVQTSLDNATVDPRAPFTLTGEGSRMEGSALTTWRHKLTNAIKMSNPEHLALMAEARSQIAAGHQVDALVWKGLDEKVKATPVAKLNEAFDAMVAYGAQRQKLCWWPASGFSTLSREAEMKVDALQERVAQLTATQDGGES